MALVSLIALALFVVAGGFTTVTLGLGLFTSQRMRVEQARLAEMEAYQQAEQARYAEIVARQKAESAKEIKAISGSSDQQPVFEVATKKSEDRLMVALKGGTAIYTVTSPSGTGSGTISLAKGQWPEAVVLRLNLKGLDSFRASNGKVTLAAAMSRSNQGQRVRLWKDSQENAPLDEKNTLWTDIRIVGEDGKPAKEIPLKDGFFEVVLPKAFFESNPKSITVEWIDFYR